MTLMKALAAAVLYAATATIANPLLAEPATTEELRAMRSGDMKKLLIHPKPKPAVNMKFITKDDTPLTSADFAGKTLLVNFWATWCAPCRKEMPQLNALQKEFGGDDFEVLTIATGRNTPDGIKRFFADAGVDSLPRHQDPKQALASQMGIFGLPITVIMDPEGREIARLRGDADWSSDSAKAIVQALIAGKADS